MLLLLQAFLFYTFCQQNTKSFAILVVIRFVRCQYLFIYFRLFCFSNLISVNAMKYNTHYLILYFQHGILRKINQIIDVVNTAHDTGTSWLEGLLNSVCVLFSDNKTIVLKHKLCKYNIYNNMKNLKLKIFIMD